MSEQRPGFESYPKIVRAGSEVEIVVRALDESRRFPADTSYEVTYCPTEAGRRNTRPLDVGARGYELTEDRLVLRARLEGEQEHIFAVEQVSGDDRLPVAEVRVYSLADDLFALRPYKGDLHLHSNKSDGRDPPAHIPGACRRIGLDFMALTDHKQYEPSLEAIRVYEGLDTDLRMYPGEEVHPPNNPVHIINFGGSSSVNALFEDKEQYLAEVRSIADGLSVLLEGKEREQYASCLWCYQKVREAGGLAVFCHPYWVHRHVYNVAEPLIAQHFEDMPFDAYEVIGGFHLHQVESNILQVARYSEERAHGRTIPIVGASDAHGCERGTLFGWYYTVLFARAPELGDIIGAVKDCRAVAVEALPGQTPRAHGPFRLVKYAQFLLREFFPLHDALCKREGELMLAHIAGDAGAAGQLQKLKGQTATLMAHAWGT